MIINVNTMPFYRTLLNRMQMASSLSKSVQQIGFTPKTPVLRRLNINSLEMLQKPATTIKILSHLQSIPAKQQIYRELHDGPMIKRTVRMKRESKSVVDSFNVFAFATSDEIYLEKLMVRLKLEDWNEQKKLIENQENQEHEPKDVLCVTLSYLEGKEPTDVFFFRQGTVVLWNCTDLKEASTILRLLKDYEKVICDPAKIIPRFFR